MVTRHRFTAYSKEFPSIFMNHIGAHIDEVDGVFYPRIDYDYDTAEYGDVAKKVCPYPKQGYTDIRSATEYIRDYFGCMYNEMLKPCRGAVNGPRNDDKLVDEVEHLRKENEALRARLAKLEDECGHLEYILAKAQEVLRE